MKWLENSFVNPYIAMYFDTSHPSVSYETHNNQLDLRWLLINNAIIREGFLLASPS